LPFSVSRGKAGKKHYFCPAIKNVKTVVMHYLAALNNKEIKAWEYLYRDYYTTLCAHAYRFVKDADCAKDIVQETLINVWNSPHCFPTKGDLLGYLHKAVYTNSINYLRTRGRHGEHLLRIQREYVPGEEETFAASVREELIRQLQAAIRELPGQRRKIMQLALEGKSGQEIAEALGITIHTVKTQKNKAFTYLRERLGDTVFFLALLYTPLKDW
jgi:RNA polymerase sigma-70 factor (ECF subfamily)